MNMQTESKWVNANQKKRQSVVLLHSSPKSLRVGRLECAVPLHANSN